MTVTCSAVTVNPRPPDRRRELLEAAEEILRTHGPHALSLRDIAERSGTSTQAVYTEFGGKPGLADALERVRSLCWAYRETVLANPHFYALMSGRPIPEYDPPAESRRYAAATFDVLIDAIRAAVDAGALLVESPRELAGLLWTAGHGHLSLVLNGLRPDDPGQWETLGDLILARYQTSS